MSRLRATSESFVTLIHPLFGTPLDGNVTALFVSVTSDTPSVGGLNDDFAPDTSNVFTMPWAMCGLPSGQGGEEAEDAVVPGLQVHDHGRGTVRAEEAPAAWRDLAVALDKLVAGVLVLGHRHVLQLLDRDAILDL